MLSILILTIVYFAIPKYISKYTRDIDRTLVTFAASAIRTDVPTPNPTTCLRYA